MHKDVEKILISEQEIKEIVQKMADEISRDYAEKMPLIIGVLKGSVVFMTDLMRAMTIDCEIDFMVASSYGKGTKTTGSVKIRKDLDTDIAGRDVIIVEDILDSGVTLSNLIQLLKTRNPKSLKLAVFLDKPERRQAPVEYDYLGTVVPDEFIVGYGLDYAEKYRNLPYIGTLKQEAAQ